MTRDELIARHCELHRSLDELLACYISTKRLGSPTLSVTIGEFLQWSHQMTIEPNCAQHDVQTPESAS